VIPFWEKPLASLSDTEWEKLCDGCGQCCLVKLQDDDTGEIFATDVVCRFLKTDSGCCSVYAERAIKKPECFVIERDKAEHYSWLPKSCAYRLRFEEKPLPSWHPLHSGCRAAMNAAEISVAGWSTSERDVDEDEWPERVIFTLHESS
jgi:uncharacterized cysteine cluster protein YcgN (CxxCxxCC family)